MRGADKVICQAAAVLLLFSISSAPAKAQFLGGGAAGGEDMMTQMAPMLEMMKAKMGKRRFAMLMRTMGPMMSRMMENGGGGFGGGLGGLAGGNLGGVRRAQLRRLHADGRRHHAGRIRRHGRRRYHGHARRRRRR